MPNSDTERTLESSDADERRETVMGLAAAGTAALPLLFRALGDADWRVRKTTVEALLSIRSESVIAGLIQALHSHDNAGARNSAMEALVQIGGRAVDALLAIVETPDPDVRKFVVDILGDIRDPRAVSALITRLGDGDENIRVAAAEALGKIRDARAVDALLACLARSDQGWLDYAAAEALGEIGDEHALGPLLAALDRSSLREPVLEALGKIGNAGTLGPLIASLTDDLRIVREVSIVAIAAIYRKSQPQERAKIIATVRAEMNSSVVESLEEILTTSSGALQKATIALLGWTGRESSISKLFALLTEEDLVDAVARSLRRLERSSAGFLITYLTNDNALVRQTAAQVLGDMEVAVAEGPLIARLSDQNGHVRSTAAMALGRLQSRAAVAPLLTLLEDEYENVQEAAIQALAAIGDESVLENLLKDFSSRETFMRRNIALLLGKFSSERALDALAFALKDEESVVRKAVVHALGAVPDGRALRSLLHAITDDDAEVRMLAAEALGKANSPEARDALILLLEDTDLWVRAAAARSLGAIGGDIVAEVLTAHLATANDIFLLAIVEVLGALNYPKAAGPLVTLTDHADPDVRKTVLAALAGYGGAAVQQTMISRLSDPHWSVRKAAIDALTRNGIGAAASLLATISESDPDATVRHAAKEALRR
jgi:HEAT repeat protein